MNLVLQISSCFWPCPQRKSRNHGGFSAMLPSTHTRTHVILRVSLKSLLEEESGNNMLIGPQAVAIASLLPDRLLYPQSVRVLLVVEWNPHRVCVCVCVCVRPDVHLSVHSAVWAVHAQFESHLIKLTDIDRH